MFNALSKSINNYVTTGLEIGCIQRDLDELLRYNQAFLFISSVSIIVKNFEEGSIMDWEYKDQLCNLIEKYPNIFNNKGGAERAQDSAYILMSSKLIEIIETSN